MQFTLEILKHRETQKKVSENMGQYARYFFLSRVFVIVMITITLRCLYLQF